MKSYEMMDQSDFSSFDSQNTIIFTSFVETYDNYKKIWYRKYFDGFINSLLYTNDKENIDLFIIVNDKSIDHVVNTLDNLNQTINESNIKIKILKDCDFEKYMYIEMTDKEEYPSVIVYRLFVPFLFPQIKDFVWLDIDMLICSNINELLKFKNENYSFIGFKDIDDRIDFSYMNSGVTLINSERIKNRYKRLSNLIKKYNEEGCITDQGFIIRDRDFLLHDEIIYNYPGFYSRFIFAFIKNKLICEKLASLAKEVKIIHFYPKDDYHLIPETLEILKENNPVYKKFENLLPRY